MTWLIFIGVAMGFGLGAFHGYRAGVRDTEKRWSDAVTRAEYDREHGHSR